MKTFTINQLGQTYEVYVSKRKYSNGRTALELIDAADGLPYAVATVNLPDVLIDQNEVLIKNYSENEGMLEFLIQNNIVKHSGYGVNNGHVWVPVCELLPENEWGTLDPPPNEINLETGKKMWEIHGYKIWAESYKQAMDLVPLIESC